MVAEEHLGLQGDHPLIIDPTAVVEPGVVERIADGTGDRAVFGAVAELRAKPYVADAAALFSFDELSAYDLAWEAPAALTLPCCR